MVRALRPTLLVGLAALLALVVSACAFDPWAAALSENQPESYYRFLRQHPDSPHAVDARERLAFFELRRDPSLMNFNAFMDEYPDSEIVDVLRPDLEESAFAVARAVGTADAYATFLRRFPHGAFTARAVGNQEFLAADGYGGRAAELRSFAARQPASDFAAEALRSAESLEVRDASRFGRVALRIEVEPTVPEGDRLVRSFREAAVEVYEAIGVPLLVGSENDFMPPADAAVLRISHSEGEVNATLGGGEFARPGSEARTLVTLTAPGSETPLWSRTFALRLETNALREGASLLFRPEARSYWSSFFVPVATWHSAAAVRDATSLGADVVAVEAAGDRAVVLFRNGEVRVIELSNPGEPVELVRHARDKDFHTFSGLRLTPSVVVLFGEDGLETLAFAEGGLVRKAQLDRSQVGSVSAVAPTGDHLLVGSNRGLLLVHPTTGQPLRLLARKIEGLDVGSGRVVFTDGETIYLSTVEKLKNRRVQAQLKLAGQQLETVRVFPGQAVITGSRYTFVLDLPADGQPKLRKRIPIEQTGKVSDATVARGRLFLLGERGMIGIDPRGFAANEMVDVAPRASLATMGRHLVAVGGESLQVIDATPFTSRSLEAQPAEIDAAD